MASCSKDPITEYVPIKGSEVSCGTQEVLSDFIWDLELEGGDKIIIQHTQSLRKMARTGNVNDLQKQLCKWNTGRTGYLKTGHKSDINNIGFASQLVVENYIIAMYHPNNYPDHFIIYNMDTKEWVRWEENGTNPRIYLEGNGD